MSATVEGLSLVTVIALIRKEIAESGVEGVAGKDGKQGLKGDRGPKGDTGPQGRVGPKGGDGKQGKAGKDGKDGADGQDGEDGVGIANIEQDVDNAIVVTMTDGTTYTVEMPLGQNTEVHYKVNGGSGGSGSIEGVVSIDQSPPGAPKDGSFWFDNSEDVMQLFIWHKDSDAWIPVAPPTTLEGRVSTGEATQQAIIEQIQESLVEQEKIKSKITQLEGAVGDHSLIFTSAQQNPRTGQFNLKDQGYQLVNSISDAKYITLNETDRNDRPIDLERIVVGDVLRLSDISSQIAELKVTGIADASVFTFDYLGGALDRLSELPYDFLLLSSFDPAGLATIDYVDERNNTKLDKAGGTVTGDIAMNGKKITALADPTADAQAATKGYVDRQVTGYKMHALWEYKDTKEAENLSDGEFTTRTTSGAEGGSMKIYLAGKDANGRRWYAWSSDEAAYSHGLGAQMCTITDHDGEVMNGGKLIEGTFNNTGNNYARLKLDYYKGNWALTPDKFYTINAAGLLPHAQYDISYENSPTSFVARDSSDKVPEGQE